MSSPVTAWTENCLFSILEHIPVISGLKKSKVKSRTLSLVIETEGLVLLGTQISEFALFSGSEIQIPSKQNRSRIKTGDRIIKVLIDGCSQDGLSGVMTVMVKRPREEDVRREIICFSLDFIRYNLADGAVQVEVNVFLGSGGAI